jgi:prepilin-type N-terminal cleavage/methylation domain-containing protein
MKERNAGFSLVELIIVIAIMAILVGVLAPLYLKYIDKSRKAKDEQVAENLLRVANVAVTDEEYYSYINVDDTITFDTEGIHTTNDVIRDKILPEYISGWGDVKVESKAYQDQCYTIQFRDDSYQNKIALKEDWKAKTN